MNPTTSPTRRKGAILALLALVATLFTLDLSGTPAGAAPIPASGTATWGIRQSYRSYINGPIANGTTQVGDGATWLAGTGTAKGAFTWPVLDATFDPATTTGTVTFGGTVYTGGHDYGDGYVLEAEWSNLRLEIAGTVGTLRADLTYRPFVGTDPSIPKPAAQTRTDVAFATVDLSGVTWTADANGNRTITNAPTKGVTAAMTLLGWDLFYYSEMPTPALDAFSLTFAEARDDSTTTTTGATTSTTAATTTTGATTTTAAPTTTTTLPVETGDAVVTGGDLSWGVKTKFVQYVNGPIAKGTITTASGASGAPAGPFLFPAVTGDEIDVTAADVRIPFRGAVTFEGHRYGTNPPALEMTFSNLVVDKTGTTGRLIADVTSRPFISTNTQEVSEPVTTLGAHLADLDFSQATVGRIGDQVGWLSVPAVIAADGAPLFGGFYEGGDVLDPLTIKLSLSVVPEELPEATEPPAPTAPTATLSATSVAAGGTITVSASGFTPFEQVEVWMHSTPTFLQTVRADAAGAVSATVTIPATAPAGQHRLELRGITSGLSVFSSTFSVTGGSTVRTVTARRTATATRSGTLVKTGTDLRAGRIGLVLLLAGATLVVTSERRRRRETPA
jgi:hypothetical protein